MAPTRRSLVNEVVSGFSFPEVRERTIEARKRVTTLNLARARGQ